MADQTVVDNFAKNQCTKDQVLDVQKDRLDNGAKSCDLTEDPDNWILTTVWPGV